MADIVTLTINPAIDASTSVEQLAPFHKMRCSPARRDPGGGGINVARVAKRFGADVCAIYTMGGTLGQLLRRLLEQEQVTGFPVPISEETREDFTVLETVSGRPYRFVLPGPRLSDQEWRACLDTFVSHASHSAAAAFRGCQWEPSARRSGGLLRPDSSNGEAGRRPVCSRQLGPGLESRVGRRRIHGETEFA